MKLSIKYPGFFRYLALTGLCVSVAMLVTLGIAMKWIAFSRVFGTYAGMVFPPLALLELLALVSERIVPNRIVPRSTVVVGAVWSLIILALAFMANLNQLDWRYNVYGQTSDVLYQLFPDKFGDLIGGSVAIVCLWLLPIGILSGLVAALKRWREPDIRQALILWQISVLVVLAWLVGVQASLKANFNLLDRYFDPVNSHIWVGEVPDVIASFTFVLLYWCLLFFTFRYAVKYLGFRHTAWGFFVSLVIAAGSIFIPRIVPVAQRFLVFAGEGGWYHFKAPYLYALRVWVGSLILMGGTLLGAGLLWFFGRQNRTVRGT